VSYPPSSSVPLHCMHLSESSIMNESCVDAFHFFMCLCLNQALCDRVRLHWLWIHRKEIMAWYLGVQFASYRNAFFPSGDVSATICSQLCTSQTERFLSFPVGIAGQDGETIHLDASVAASVRRRSLQHISKRLVRG
jgi:hypothetical protein